MNELGQKIGPSHEIFAHELLIFSLTMPVMPAPIPSLSCHNDREDGLLACLLGRYIYLPMVTTKIRLRRACLLACFTQYLPRQGSLFWGSRLWLVGWLGMYCQGREGKGKGEIRLASACGFVCSAFTKYILSQMQWNCPLLLLLPFHLSIYLSHLLPYLLTHIESINTYLPTLLTTSTPTTSRNWGRTKNDDDDG